MAEGVVMNEASEPDVLDRLAVEETLYRYWSHIDAGHFTALRALFTDDARGRYFGDEWIDGGDALVEWLTKISASAARMHHMGKVYRVDIDGDRATAHCYMTAHLIGIGDPDALMVSIGDYVDELRRGDGAWRISLLDFRSIWGEWRRADQHALPG